VSKYSGVSNLANALKEYNLELIKRGNGVVIADIAQKLFVKASDVDRSLSKQSLIKRFGDGVFNEKSFNDDIASLDELNNKEQKNTKNRINDIKSTAKQTINPRQKYESSSNKLWQEFKKYQSDNISQKSQAIQNTKSKNQKAFEDLKHSFASKREDIKLNQTLSAKEKFYAYQYLHDMRLREQKKLRQDAKDKLSGIYAQFKPKSYDEFLETKVNNGDEKATVVLDSRLKAKANKQSNQADSPKEPQSKQGEKLDLHNTQDTNPKQVQDFFGKINEFIKNSLAIKTNQKEQLTSCEGKTNATMDKIAQTLKARLMARADNQTGIKPQDSGHNDKLEQRQQVKDKSYEIVR
jgi:hypothetical protein